MPNNQCATYHVGLDLVPLQIHKNVKIQLEENSSARSNLAFTFKHYIIEKKNDPTALGATHWTLLVDIVE